MWNKQYRFTVNTRDAVRERVSNGLGGFSDRKYTWKLNFGSVMEQNADYKMSIESLQSNVDVDTFTIRCENVMSKYFYDSRPSTYGYTPIIFNGNPRAFFNSNAELFTYEVNKDIFNSDFVLYMDSNEDNDVGINQSRGIDDAVCISITFVLTEYRNE